MSDLEAIEPSASSVTSWRGRLKHVLRVVGFIGLVAIVFAAGTVFGLGAAPQPTHPEEFALIADSWELLHSEYIDAEHLDPSVLAYGAITGMADAVGDTGHTYFLTPDEVAAEDEALSGGYGGIGLDFRVAGEPTAISSLVSGAPAILSGLRVGDKIVAVNGTSTGGPDVYDVLDGLRGKPGTDVVVTVARPGQAGTLEFRVTRAIVDRDSTSWAMIPGTQFAFVQLYDFPDGATEELSTALNAAIDAGATGVILDLRGNPGGYVYEAVGVVGLFLGPSVTALREEGASRIWTSDLTPSEEIATDVPLVVLVDGDSASSAEIVAGALQDYQRAVIVGTTTFGTGTILSDYLLADGSSLSIGTEWWETPHGRSVWHVGLTADVEVSLPAGAIPLTPEDVKGLTAKKLAKSKDAQLLRALKVLKAG